MTKLLICKKCSAIYGCKTEMDSATLKRLCISCRMYYSSSGCTPIRKATTPIDYSESCPDCENKP